MSQRTILFIIIMLTLCLSTSLSERKSEATGGAFTFVKHGGFPVDGNIPCAGGVNRGLGVDYGGDCTKSVYREPGTVDVYKSGECTHCHELHASFGASEKANGEPAPNKGGNAGPDRYLLMHEYGTNLSYAELCLYCHNNFTIGPQLGYGQWGFFQGGLRFKDSSHFRSPVFQWPGPHPDEAPDPSPMIWPRKSRKNLKSGNTGSCLNCHTPHGIRVPGLDEWAVSRNIQGESLAGNYGFIIQRQLIAWEEGLCMRCHSKIGPADGWKDEFRLRGVREQFKFSPNKMPVILPDLPVKDRHNRTKENVFASNGKPLVTQNWNPTGGRHVECYDCHNPHTIWDKQTYDDPGPHRQISGSHRHESGEVHSNKASGVLRGIWGVSLSNWPPNWSTPNGVSPTYTVTPQVTKEYELCMKCHTFFGFQSNIPKDKNGRTYTDESHDFNPNNAAYHPVVMPTGRTLDVRNIPPAKNPWKEPFRNPGIQTMYCTDCHGADNGAASTTTADSSDMARGPGLTVKNQPRGPHGSKNPFILKGDWFRYNDSKSSAGNRSNEFLLCFKCHRRGAYGAGNKDGGSSSFAKSRGGNLHNFHQGITGSNLRCVRCHIQVPHGWRRRSLLIDMDGDDGTYQNPKPQFQRYINRPLGGRKGTLPSPASWSESNCGGRDWMSSYCESG